MVITVPEAALDKVIRVMTDENLRFQSIGCVDQGDRIVVKSRVGSVEFEQNECQQIWRYYKSVYPDRDLVALHFCLQTDDMQMALPVPGHEEEVVQQIVRYNNLTIFSTNYVIDEEVYVMDVVNVEVLDEGESQGGEEERPLAEDDVEEAEEGQ